MAISFGKWLLAIASVTALGCARTPEARGAPVVVTPRPEPAPDEVAGAEEAEPPLRDACDEEYEFAMGERCSVSANSDTACADDDPGCDVRVLRAHHEACVAMAKRKFDVCKCSRPDANAAACDALDDDYDGDPTIGE